MNTELMKKAEAIVSRSTMHTVSDSEGTADWVMSLMDEDGYPNASMITAAKADGFQWIAFCTAINLNKPNRAKKNPRACVYLFDKESCAFINELDGYQLSVHSQVWMILGGVIAGERAKELLLSCLSDGEAKQPVTPYMRHYVAEAMLKLGMRDEAVQYLKKYWGGMIELGADTFWEAYVPENPEFSPYDDRMINSLCHAWSCTPSYFIRKYGL